MSRKTIILPKGRRARSGSPWIFSNEIRIDAAAKALAPGTVVNVRGEDGRGFGTGYFNPKSLIAVRLLAEECDTVVGQEFFAERLTRALKLRDSLYTKPFYRLVHAEGDHLPGLVIDRFGDTLTVQIGTAGMEKQRGPILAALDQILSPATVIVRGDTPSRALEGLDSYVETVKGKGHRIAVEENGARYIADLAEGQKTGWYYDQRDNRAFIAGFAKGKSVLDAYSYTGGFGILAAAAGARETCRLDSLGAGAGAGRGKRARQQCEDQGGQGRCVRGAGAADRRRREIRYRAGRSAAFREIQKRSGAGRQGLSQAGAAGRRSYCPERPAAAGVLLAQYSA